MPDSCAFATPTGRSPITQPTLPTMVLTEEVDHPQKLLADLRDGSPAIIGRIENERVIFDPRTILPQSDTDFMRAFKQIWSDYEK